MELKSRWWKVTLSTIERELMSLESFPNLFWMEMNWIEVVFYKKEHTNGQAELKHKKHENGNNKFSKPNS